MFIMSSKLSIPPILVLLLPFFVCSIFSSSAEYPAVFNFGDSNSDTGGLAAGIAFPVGEPYGQTYFLKPSGRFCDGRLIVDFLMDEMDLPFLNPYMESIGAPTFRTGCNFATGGSTALPVAASSTTPFSLGIQVSQFLRFKNRVLELIEKDKKRKKYLPLESYFKKGLYMFDVGQNEVDGAFYTRSEEQVLGFIPTILEQLQTAFKILYNEGARNYWIHNMGPLGCLPRIISTFGKNQSLMDQNGCVISHNDAAKQFNSQLHDLCTTFKSQFLDAQVTYVDIFSIKSTLITDFAQFGFKQNVEACCGFGGPPLNYDGRIACGASKVINGSFVTAKACENVTEYVNWDGNHYTEAANRFVSDRIRSGNYSENVVEMGFNFMVGSDSYGAKTL